MLFFFGFVLDLALEGKAKTRDEEKTRVAVAGLPGCTRSLIPRLFWTIDSYSLLDVLYTFFHHSLLEELLSLSFLRTERLCRARKVADSARDITAASDI